MDEIQCNRIIGMGYNVLELSDCLIGNVEAFIEWCHDHGFECGEYITGEIFDTNDERCFLCEMASYKGFSNCRRYNQFILGT